MSVKKFKFVSPGIFINEIDNSGVTKLGEEMGPVIIGTSLRGPAMVPTRIESFADFVETFGEPLAGGEGSDVWREGNRLAPTYAAFAAQAYLRNASPVTFVRLLGEAHPDSTDKAGWVVEQPGDAADTTGAYGLFIANSAAEGDTDVSAALAAILYVKGDGEINLFGDDFEGNTNLTKRNHWIASTGDNNQFKLKVTNGTGTETISFNFNKNSRGYIRNVLNTNPTLCNGHLFVEGESTKQKSYFLGETYDRHLAEIQKGITTAAGAQAACLVALDGAGDWSGNAQPALTPWIISQHNGAASEFNSNEFLDGSIESAGVEKLLRLHSLYAGEWERKNLKVSIEDVKAPTDRSNPYGSFSVVIRKAEDTDASKSIVERFSSCNLNPASPNYVAKMVGDMRLVWDEAERRYTYRGEFENQSRFVRVELAESVASGSADPRLLPFGFLGPARYKDIPVDISGVPSGDAMDVILASAIDGATSVVTPAVTAVQATIEQAGLVLVADETTYPGVSATDDGLAVAFITNTPVAGGNSVVKITKPDPHQWTIHTTQSPEHLITIGDIAKLINEGTLGGTESLPDDTTIPGIDFISSDTDVPTFRDSFSSTTSFTDSTSADELHTGGTLILFAGGVDGTEEIIVGGSTFVLKFPKMGLRETSLDSNLSSARDAVFGISTLERGSASVFDSSYADLAGFLGKPQGSPTSPANDSGLVQEHQFIFTLDDIRLKAIEGKGTDPNTDSTHNPNHYEWVAGCRAFVADETPANSVSITAAEGGFEKILERGVDSFTLPLLGGRDGVDIFQIQPFGYHRGAEDNTGLPSQGDSALTHYALNSYKKAIDSVSDPEVVEMNLLAAPGMSHPAVTNHMISVCETRGDALAVIDIEGDYMPRGLTNKLEDARMPSVKEAIDEMRRRAINSSYGCAFFPWVQMADPNSGRLVWIPPSIAALGTMASSTAKSELWFAPAGFTRGGLTDGSAGVAVNAVRLRLNSKERDSLYEANINPIAQFPAEGIVIFGQKTLQVTPSALDRINVRRLMIYLKKQISRMAKTVLFDQNVKNTWIRFTSEAEPFLASVKSRFGLSEYRLILDESTTTQDLIDRNIMYAKILLKPTRAIEYIAIDFVITDSGASFED